MAKRAASGKRAPVFRFEYVTSTVSLLVSDGQGDGIVVAVVNDSPSPESTRVVIYQNTGAGAVVVADTGPLSVVPSWQWSLGFTASSSGEYWLRVQATSEFLVPKASFERFRDSVWVPVVSYRPGDFAVFRLRPSRRRIW